MCKVVHPILRLHMFEPMLDWTITKYVAPHTNGILRASTHWFCIFEAY
jgi:hypothetical protein